MSWVQVLPFDSSKMGKRKGWCLQNCAKGFGITQPTFPSAKADMEWQLKNGYLHSMDSVPSNCAVTVYLDTTSRYEHVVVADNGIWWEDGHQIKPYTKNIYGWGEFCDGHRIVKWVDDPKPQGFLPPKGYWGYGDRDARIGQLCWWYAEYYYGYFCKTRKEAHKLLDGNFFGNNCYKWTKEFQKRAKAEGNYNSTIDGMVGKYTYTALQIYGFTG